MQLKKWISTTQSQERNISDYEIQISEDVESVKSLIELYLKIAL